MSILKLLAAATVLSTAIATPVPAQQVIYEPSYCAFFYPNANCQNKRPGNPYTDPNYERGTLTSTADHRREIGGIIAAPTRLRGNLPGP